MPGRRTLFYFILLAVAVMADQSSWSKEPITSKKISGTIAKGEFTINPGQTVPESLSQNDGQFEDNTYYDQYNLNWPGGDLVITLDSNDFDEYLVVIEPPGFPDGNQVDIDSIEGFPPEVYERDNAEPGNYTIWATSYDVEFGDYQISISESNAVTPTPTPSPTQCPSPDAPSNPSPAHESVGIPTDVDLTWSAKSIPKVIYGPDDRMEVFEVQDPDILAAADSTVLVVGLSEISDNGNGTYTLDNQSFTDYINGSEGLPLCSNEPYRTQPVPGNCTGFLVGPDLVVTAGHCMTGSGDCGSNAFVFGFDMIDANTPRLTVDSSEVYFCTEIVGRAETSSGPDWAVVRLDRPVDGHTPLQIRRTGKIANNEDLIIIGHPVGLPKKIAGNAVVRENGASSFFVANLDSYSGNSGSPVFNANDMVVEGVLVRGNADFTQNGACTESVRCSNSGCRGEDCNRTTEFAGLVPEISTLTYTVFFGECGSLSQVGTTEQPSWDLPLLEAGKTYCWQIQVVNECGGSVLGPLWSFTTEGETPTPTPTDMGANPTPTVNPRADVNGDSVIDSLDLLEVLENWHRTVSQ